MESIRTMQGDLQKASQSPKDVASAFNKNMQGAASQPGSSVGSSKKPLPSLNISRGSSVKNTLPKENADMVSQSKDLKPAPANLPITQELEDEIKNLGKDKNEKNNTGSSSESLIGFSGTISGDMKKDEKPKNHDNSQENYYVPPSSVPARPPLPKIEPLSGLSKTLDSYKEKPKEKKPEFTESDGRNQFILKWGLVSIAILMLIGGGVYGYYKFFNVKPPIVIDEPPVDGGDNWDINSINVHESLVATTSTIKLAFRPGSDLVGVLKSKTSSLNLEKNLFNRILVAEEGASSFLGLDSLITELNLTVPQKTSDSLSGKYMFFVYNQEEGLRYGLVMETIRGVSSEMKEWEPNMLRDFSSLLVDGTLEGAEKYKFESTVYKKTDVRYVNLPNNSATIDYATKNDLLLITTSKNSMFGLIDLIGT